MILHSHTSTSTPSSSTTSAMAAPWRSPASWASIHAPDSTPSTVIWEIGQRLLSLPLYFFLIWIKNQFFFFLKTTQNILWEVKWGSRADFIENNNKRIIVWRRNEVWEEKRSERDHREIAKLRRGGSERNCEKRKMKEKKRAWERERKSESEIKRKKQQQNESRS